MDVPEALKRLRLFNDKADQEMQETGLVQILDRRSIADRLMHS